MVCSRTMVGSEGVKANECRNAAPHSRLRSIYGPAIHMGDVSNPPFNYQIKPHQGLRLPCHAMPPSPPWSPDVFVILSLCEADGAVAQDGYT